MADEDKPFFRALLEIITAITPMQVVTSLIGLSAIGGIVWVITAGADFLRDADKLNGLIKFSAAIVTIAIALILTFYFVSRTGNPDEKSFRLELLRIITAVTPMQWVASLIGLFAIGGMVWVIAAGADFFLVAEKARGLITFSVAIVTVSIALILVFYLVFGTGSTEELKDRFTYGKDILMVFVGILGTIMGFYYGSDKISTKDVSAIASTVQNAETGAVATDDLEKKALNALLAKDFDGALKGYDDAYKVTPTLHNIDEVRKLLIAQKDAFKTAADTNDEEKKAELWQKIFCDISTNNKKLGMTDVMKAKVDGYCKPPASPTPNTNPTTP